MICLDCEPPIVVVAAIIGEDGHARISQSFTPRSNPCTNPAILAIKQSSFQPARLNRLPVAVKVCLSVSFGPDQPSFPSLVRCPRQAESDRQDEEDSLPAEARATKYGREVAPNTTGPMETSAPKPIPDEYGVYSVGPGIASPRLTSAAEATPAEAVGGCTHPIVVSAVIAVDGSIKVHGVYAVNPPHNQPCDNLAIVTIEQSRAQPATLNGVPVPIHVCLGVPFGRPVPPVTRPTYCPHGIGATPIGDTDAFVSQPGTKLPVVIFSPTALQYTWEARKKKIHGSVIISLLVTEDGLPTDPHVLKSLGYGLDEIALDAARKYRFQPATLDGKPVPVRTTVELKFRLD